MSQPSVLAIIQAGGEGSRMDVLTLERAKPALPFAASYQLIDFPLSNLVNSEITDVWVSMEYEASALEQVVRNGRPWDLDRTVGGLRMLIPQQGSGGLDEEGFAQGNADELFRIRDQIRREGPDLVLVMSADHVYRLDYRDLVARHLEKDAEATIVVKDIAEVYGEDPGDHAVVSVNRQRRVTGFAYKPDDPAGSTIATEVFCYRTDVLLEVLEDLHREIATDLDDDRGPGDTGLGDFGDRLLPRLQERGRLYAYELEEFWRDMGQPHHYLNGHLELVDSQTDLDLFAHDWRIRSQQPQRPAPYLGASAEVTNSMIGQGSFVHGRVERSVLGPGVVVEEGADVSESVLVGQTVVRAGARVCRTIVDAGCELGDGARVGDSDTDLTDPDAITIVGADSVLTGRVAGGGRVPPGTRA